MTFTATVTEAHEPVVRCPNCSHDIRLTESLAAPLLEENRRRFQEQMAHKDAEIARKNEVLVKERDDLAKARDQVEDQIKQRLAVERNHLVAAEAKKAREAAAIELQAKSAEAAELRRTLEANNVKLAEAQKAQADVLRKQRELDDEKREIDLTVEKAGAILRRGRPDQGPARRR
ncbi:hypothetical protein ABIB80_006889 [Bradyrhizobium sp. i1.15.2]